MTMVPIDTLYQRLARPVLFRIGRGDAETAHTRTLALLAALGRRPRLLRTVDRLLAVPAAPRTVCGLEFPRPVGVAAGADKDGVALRAWPALGFGFVEAGTVTAIPQPGNPRPRVTRLPASGAVINRMGFPNAGAAALAGVVSRTPDIGVPLGISIGKSKAVAVDEAIGDYLVALRAVVGHADYLAVNVSSPNTPGLRGLQDRAALDALVDTLVGETAALATVGRTRRGRPPLLVKISPDLTPAAITDVLQVCHDRGVSGIIATNTTTGRDGIAGTDEHLAGRAGGLSGTPLHGRAVRVVEFVRSQTDLPIIGVGGIDSTAAAQRMFDAGAQLVQLYTGLLYRGPGLVGAIARTARKGADR